MRKISVLVNADAGFVTDAMSGWIVNHSFGALATESWKKTDRFNLQFWLIIFVFNKIEIQHCLFNYKWNSFILVILLLVWSYHNIVAFYYHTLVALSGAPQITRSHRKMGHISWEFMQTWE